MQMSSPSDEDDANCASHSARRVAAMVSNTGCTSLGEREMTLEDLAVAVCCSSDSVSSRVRACTCLEQPRVLDGDDGLVGEGLQQLDLPVGERAHLVARTTMIAPIGHAAAQQRHGQTVPGSPFTRARSGPSDSATGPATSGTCDRRRSTNARPAIDAAAERGRIALLMHAAVCRAATLPSRPSADHLAVET